jgi:hypothetical protein
MAMLCTLVYWKKWYLDTEQADSAQRIPIVHDAKRFEVDRLVHVAFNSNGTGLLFKVRWAASFNVPSEDIWEPMRGVDHLDIFFDFFERMSIETFLRPLILSDFATASLQEPRRHQNPEQCCIARTLLLKEGRVSYPRPFI